MDTNALVPVASKTEMFDTGYADRDGNQLEYLVTIQALAQMGNAGRPLAWRVYGQQIRAGRPWGRTSVPRVVFSMREALSMARTIFEKHRRYIERNHARAQLRAAAAEEDLDRLAGGLR